MYAAGHSRRLLPALFPAEQWLGLRTRIIAPTGGLLALDTMFTIGISRASHLLLICTGAPVFDDFLAVADLAAAVCHREGWARVLIDCASVPPTFTEDQRAELATYAAAAVPLQHLAIVFADEKRFDAADSAAASAGSKLRYFTTIADAAHWLAVVEA